MRNLRRVLKINKLFPLFERGQGCVNKKKLFLDPFFSLFFFGLVVILSSCEDRAGTYLPGYSGNAGEIVLVIENNHFEESKETIYQTIAKYQHGTPQAERVFSIVNIPHKSFTKIFQVNRNIIIADIRPNTVQKIEIKKNVWAKKQLVITISAGSVETFNNVLEKHSDDIIAKLQEIEIERLIERNKKFGTENSLEKHKLKLTLQKDAGIVVDSSNFVWIRIERERPMGEHQHQISQGVLIYYAPYLDTSQFSSKTIFLFKDSITKRYVPGPTDGSYMSTSYKHILPYAKEMMINGQYAVRTTGLWRMQNSYMGGPFVTITTLDAKNNRIVTLEGYVFAPQFEKREYLREVEAIMRSVEFL